MKGCFFVLLWVFVVNGCIFLAAAQTSTQNATYACREINPGNITMTFSIEQNADFISQICFYQVGDTSDMGVRMCVNKTSYPFSISLEADPAGSPVSDTGIETMTDNRTISYLLRSFATEPGQDVTTDRFYPFNCSLDNLIPSSVEIAGFNAKLKDNVRRLRSKPKSLYMVACDADTDMPVTSAELGSLIYLQILFNRGDGFVGDDTFGLIIYVSFLQQAESCDLVIFSREKTIVNITSFGGTSLDSILLKDSVYTYNVPSGFLAAASIGTMKVGQNGLRVESLYDYAEISVVVKCETTDSAAAYVGIPYEVLGTEYYATTFSPGPGRGAQCVIVGTQDDTEVSITFPMLGFNSISFGGTTFTGGDTAHVNISDYQTIHVHVENVTLSRTHITSNKPVAVICGNTDAKIPTNGDENVTADMMMDAMIPEHRIGKKYVLFPVDYPSADNQDTVVLFQSGNGVSFTPSVEGFSGFTITMYGATAVNYSSFGNNSARAIGDGSDEPYHVVQFIPSLDIQNIGVPLDASLTVLPSIQMWSDTYIWPVTEGRSYRMIVVSYIGTSGNIIFQKDTGTSIAGDVLFMNTTSAVLPVPGDPIKYEISEATVQASSDKYFSLSIPLRTNPFMTVVYEYDPSRQVTWSYVPPGLRLPVVSGCMNTETVHGDGKDNDCDGSLNEEKENYIDDDGDSLIDEDLARAIISFADVNAAWVETLDSSPNPLFDGVTLKLILDGCSTTKYIGVFSQVDVPDGPGEKYVTLQTQAFKAFRFADETLMNFKAFVAFCKGDDPRCMNSCQSRKKRSEKEGPGVKNVDFVLRVEPNRGFEEFTQAPIQADDTGACGEDIGFLAIVAALMVLLLLETAFSSAFVIRLKVWKNGKHLK